MARNHYFAIGCITLTLACGGRTDPPKRTLGSENGVTEDKSLGGDAELSGDEGLDVGSGQSGSGQSGSGQSGGGQSGGGRSGSGQSGSGQPGTAVGTPSSAAGGSPSAPASGGMSVAMPGNIDAPTMGGGSPLPAGLPWPDSCTNGRSESYPGGCFAQIECDQKPAFVNCDGTGEQTQCYCQAGSGGFVQISLSGVPAQEACTPALQACLDVSDNGVEACKLTSQSAGPDYCDATRECTFKAPMNGTGAQFGSIYRTDGVSCYGRLGDSECNCHSDGRRFLFEGKSVDVGLCDTGIQLCNEVTLGPLGPATCQQESIYADRYSCGLNDSCLRSGTSPQGTPFQAIETRGVTCSNNALLMGPFGPMAPGFPGKPPSGASPMASAGDANLWTCNCNSSFQTLGSQFELKGENSLEVCQRGAASCAGLF